MHLKNLDKILPLLLAAKDGKTIQEFNTGEWRDIPMDRSFGYERPEYYRIKPAAVLRAWKQEEVPILARLRTRRNIARPEDDGVTTIVGASSRGASFFVNDISKQIPEPKGYIENYNALLQYREHSIDNGKTWLPCGVWE